MNGLFLNSELSIRLAAFSGIFLLVAVWEVVAPRRALTVSKAARWTSNLGITFFNGLLLTWVFPVLAVGMAALAQSRGWGVLNDLDLPFWLIVTLSVVALDFVIYIQHAMFHTIPAFWRMHRMHHTDLNLDVSSGSRFHPIEIIVSMGIKFTAIAALGPPPVAVLIFELFLNVMAMFNHGNIYIPLKIDRILRWFVVTPDMHRVHHSIIRKENNSNFGFNLSLWDYLLGTYRAQPEKGHDGMEIGINIFRDPKLLNFHWLLIQPFLNSDKYD